VDRVRVGNLPTELTSFVGRRREVGEVKRLLADGRLVTLTGVGGTGKTRLALYVATELRRAFPDGVWFVDLTQLPGPGPLTPRAQGPHVLACLVADALGLRVRSAEAPLPQLIDQLADRQILLILDNCEHLIAACSTLADAGTRRWPCSSPEPRPSAPAFNSPSRIAPRWPTSAASWTGCRWRSSWPPRASARWRRRRSSTG
jgi:hypothetical protein